ncbi:NUDIX domain-containing protein [Cellulomonas sp. PS-H5]|uniref:NUDIX domain-containing protein n=1 Tax=Cellulomonas sp. PS-H5 TaxID=2820400 RepID=UPI0027E2F083|nr:NUDIX domain-containing protein [Cellulomonas sp. PS-H5]
MPRRPHHPGDGWVECRRCGRRHWGTAGAAGLLLARPATATDAAAVVLQHRAPWSDQGGTWGLPGGARHTGESAVDGALRESQEEAGIEPASVRVVGEHVLDHEDWSYTTIVAVTSGPVDARPTDDESLAIAWVALDDVAALPLLPAFADAWPALRAALPPEVEGAAS